jgi:hypothetical protein
MAGESAVKNSSVPAGNEEGARILVDIKNVPAKRPGASSRAQARRFSEGKSATDGPLIGFLGDLFGGGDQSLHIVFCPETTELDLPGKLFD